MHLVFVAFWGVFAGKGACPPVTFNPALKNEFVLISFPPALAASQRASSHKTMPLEVHSEKGQHIILNRCKTYSMLLVAVETIVEV